MRGRAVEYTPAIASENLIDSRVTFLLVFEFLTFVVSIQNVSSESSHTPNPSLPCHIESGGNKYFRTESIFTSLSSNYTPFSTLARSTLSEQSLGTVDTFNNSK